SSSHGVRLSSPSSSRRWASLRRRPRVRSSALLYGGGRPVDTQTLIVTASVLAAVALSLFLGLKVTPPPYALFTSEKNPDFEAGRCRERRKGNPKRENRSLLPLSPIFFLASIGHGRKTRGQLGLVGGGRCDDDLETLRASDLRFPKPCGAVSFVPDTSLRG
ncbi:hypothetical protein GW17_00055011, partial [Ensete ventricosum]